MADTASSGSSDSSPQVEKGWPALKQHIIDNKIKFGLWVTRVFTIIFTIGYIIPIFGNPYNIYYKVLMNNAATSALRLHQRVPRVQLTRQFLETLLLEDSCHYLFYSLIFLYAAPVTLVLTPVFLFAVMHLASYSLILLDCLGQNSWWGARLLISLVEFQSRNILRLCALSEIIILPFTVLLVFTGRAGLLTPFIYYQFLKLRLASQRNPFTRNVFYELRNGLSSVSRKPAVPDIVRRMIDGLLSLTQQMAPGRNLSNYAFDIHNAIFTLRIVLSVLFGLHGYPDIRFQAIRYPDTPEYPENEWTMTSLFGYPNNNLSG